MHVTCPHCESAYDVDLPESVLNSGRKRLKFRCGVCSQRFIIELEQPASAGGSAATETPGANQSSAPDAAPPSSSTAMRLRQEGTEYELADVATLQRWIVERRINPHDEISFDGETWESVGSRPDLKVFFQVVNQVEQAELKNRAPSSDGDLPREDTEEANWGSDGGGMVGQGGDAFADLRGEEGESNGDVVANWDPMDPPNPRFQTDHGFNPSTMRSTAPDPFQEEDTHGHDVPGMGVSAEAEPDPKTIALGAPIDPQEVPDPDDFDALFGGPTEIDGMTEEVAYPPSTALPEPFSSHEDSLFPPDEADMFPPDEADMFPPDEADMFPPDEADMFPSGEGEDDAFFQAPAPDDSGMEPEGPDLPSMASSFPTDDSDFPPMDDFSQEDSFSGGQTLFSVTDDDFLMDEDDDWEKEQARASQTRKRGLMAIAGLGLLVLAFQLIGGEDTAEDGEEKTSSTTSTQVEVSSSETEQMAADQSADNSQTPTKPTPSTDSTLADTTETSPVVQKDEGVAQSKPDTSSPKKTTVASTKSTSTTKKPAPQAAVPSSGFNSLVQDGWKYGDRGDYKTAERRFADAVQMKPNNAEALFGLGYAREQLGKAEQAFSHYCMTLKHESSSGENHREALGRLKAMGRSCTP